MAFELQKDTLIGKNVGFVDSFNNISRWIENIVCETEEGDDFNIELKDKNTDHPRIVLTKGEIDSLSSGPQSGIEITCYGKNYEVTTASNISAMAFGSEDDSNITFRLQDAATGLADIKVGAYYFDDES